MHFDMNTPKVADEDIIANEFKQIPVKYEQNWQIQFHLNKAHTYLINQAWVPLI